MEAGWDLESMKYFTGAAVEGDCYNCVMKMKGGAIHRRRHIYGRG
ncbi:hypothetical protein [Salinicoccus sp. RF5]|nr:hypothetical protein [Salinicoccus sp. RF5]